MSLLTYCSLTSAVLSVSCRLTPDGNGGSGGSDTEDSTHQEGSSERGRDLRGCRKMLEKFVEKRGMRTVGRRGREGGFLGNLNRCGRPRLYGV